MKRNILAITALAGLLAGGVALAQNASGNGARGQGLGFGYGGPPRSAEERAARQAACLERNGGVCPQGGPRAECPRLGQGKGWAKGYGYRRGLRDGTGPRSVDGTCPLGNTPAPRARQ